MSMKPRQLVELSQPFEKDLPVYHIYSKPLFGIYHAHDRGDCFYDRTASFYTHSGTHMDAPSHFSSTGAFLDQIPLTTLVNEAVILDMPRGPLGTITGEDFEKAKADFGIKEGDGLIVNTGWHRNYREPNYATEFPGIVKSGAQWLVDNKIKLIGMDWICIDHPSQTDMGDNSWASHVTVLTNGIPVIENIGGDVDLVSGKRVLLMALPVRVVNGDGFPLRVVAALD